MVASVQGYAEVVTLLIDAGVDVNACCNGVTALMEASENGHAEVAALLRNAGAEDTDEVDPNTVFENQDFSDDAAEAGGEGDAPAAEEVHTDGDGTGANCNVAREVTLSTGLSIGMQLEPLTHDDGCGVHVFSTNSGGQAESTGKVFAGDVITHVNGVSVSKTPLIQVIALIKAESTVTFALVAFDTYLLQVSSPRTFAKAGAAKMLVKDAPTPKKGSSSSSSSSGGGGGGKTVATPKRKMGFFSRLFKSKTKGAGSGSSTTGLPDAFEASLEELKVHDAAIKGYRVDAAEAESTALVSDYKLLLVRTLSLKARSVVAEVRGRERAQLDEFARNNTERDVEHFKRVFAVDWDSASEEARSTLIALADQEHDVIATQLRAEAQNAELGARLSPIERASASIAKEVERLQLRSESAKLRALAIPTDEEKASAAAEQAALEKAANRAAVEKEAAAQMEAAEADIVATAEQEAEEADKSDERKGRAVPLPPLPPFSMPALSALPSTPTPSAAPPPSKRIKKQAAAMKAKLAAAAAARPGKRKYGEKTQKKKSLFNRIFRKAVKIDSNPWSAESIQLAAAEEESASLVKEYKALLMRAESLEVRSVIVEVRKKERADFALASKEGIGLGQYHEYERVFDLDWGTACSDARATLAAMVGRGHEAFAAQLRAEARNMELGARLVPIEDASASIAEEIQQLKLRSEAVKARTAEIERKRAVFAAAEAACMFVVRAMAISQRAAAAFAAAELERLRQAKLAADKALAEAAAVEVAAAEMEAAAAEMERLRLEIATAEAEAAVEAGRLRLIAEIDAERLRLEAIAAEAEAAAEADRLRLVAEAEAERLRLEVVAAEAAREAAEEEERRQIAIAKTVAAKVAAKKAAAERKAAEAAKVQAEIDAAAAMAAKEAEIEAEVNAAAVKAALAAKDEVDANLKIRLEAVEAKRTQMIEDAVVRATLEGREQGKKDAIVALAAAESNAKADAARAAVEAATEASVKERAEGDAAIAAVHKKVEEDSFFATTQAAAAAKAGVETGMSPL